MVATGWPREARRAAGRSRNFLPASRDECHYTPLAIASPVDLSPVPSSLPPPPLPLPPPAWVPFCDLEPPAVGTWLLYFRLSRQGPREPSVWSWPSSSRGWLPAQPAPPLQSMSQKFLSKVLHLLCLGLMEKGKPHPLGTTTLFKADFFNMEQRWAPGC